MSGCFCPWSCPKCDTPEALERDRQRAAAREAERQLEKELDVLRKYGVLPPKPARQSDNGGAK